MELGLQSVLAFRSFISKYGDLKTFYPCCGFDSSPSEVFSDVTYLDKNEKAIESLKGQGLRAICGEVLDFDYKCELMILINPSIKAELLVSRFRPRYVICNNLHGTAEELEEVKGYRFVEMLAVDFWLFEKAS